MSVRALVLLPLLVALGGCLSAPDLPAPVLWFEEATYRFEGPLLYVNVTIVNVSNATIGEELNPFTLSAALSHRDQEGKGIPGQGDEVRFHYGRSAYWPAWSGLAHSHDLEALPEYERLPMGFDGELGPGGRFEAALVFFAGPGNWTELFDAGWGAYDERPLGAGNGVYHLRFRITHQLPDPNYGGNSFTATDFDAGCFNVDWEPYYKGEHDGRPVCSSEEAFWAQRRPAPPEHLRDIRMQPA